MLMARRVRKKRAIVSACRVLYLLYLFIMTYTLRAPVLAVAYMR